MDMDTALRPACGPVPRENRVDFMPGPALRLGPFSAPLPYLPSLCQAFSLPATSSSSDILQAKPFVLHGRLTAPLPEVILAPASRRKSSLFHGSPHWELG